MRIKRQLSRLIFATTIGLSSIAHAATPLDNTTFTFNGYIKLDALASQYSDGTIASGSIARDFYIPSLTPVGGNDEGTQFDIHVRQTRFRFGSETQLTNGDKITGVLELDFQVVPDGNERISNSHQARIRHGYLKYKNWTLGQTWTTFLDASVFPETLDFIGITDGIIFVRQPLIRYTQGAFEFAIENPETTITPFGGGARIVSDDNSVPDFIGRYTLKRSWGHVSLAAIARQLSLQNEQNGNNISTTDSAFGINLTSKINLGEDDIRLTFNTGSGLGRYSALNAANGAVLNANNEIEAIDTTGLAIAYRHLWNAHWRSTFTYSQFHADNDVTLTGSSATEKTFSTRANIIYSPTPELKFGAELTYAERTIESGLEGDLNRLQFSAQYSF